MRMAAKQSRLLAVLGVLTMAGCCCCGGGDLGEALQQGANQITSMANVTQLTNAVTAYKRENGEWPASLEDVRDNVANFDTVMSNPATTSNPGYEYVKPTSNDPSYDTVIIYQLRDGARDATLAKGYANGTVGTSPSNLGGTGDSTDEVIIDETDETEETDTPEVPDSSSNETEASTP